MRILCLHGYGTNPEVLKYQISGLRKAADVSWDFHYLSGQVTCSAAPGIESVFPGPFYCYTREFDPEGVGASYALLEKSIEENGPFQGVLGFSQGAATIVGYLLEQKTAYPDEPLPFQFMVICSPTTPLSSDSNYSQGIFGSLGPESESYIRSSQDAKIQQLPEPARTAVTAFTSVIDVASQVTQEPRSFYLDHPMSKIPAVLHPDLLQTRLSIPALHVRGANEPSAMRNCGRMIESFCDTNKQRVVEHTAGHDIPRVGSELGRIISAMEWIVAQSQLPTL
ncbi:hypothetical protein PDE_04439 [Penicillium oxalicum 114-2]|uniref:Serine hydrolase domain-containing protein n=1 Tax=Penicillium oxalicum (strain 114-2 / CGMCC 5302) TaxID=933388 RepID=S7ZGR9_PENO1|nr:hypothetical protein PDE_04439 [Penicillium oxalicum 114-2]